MTAYETAGTAWRDDPAREVVAELYQELSEELGTDGPADTFGHPDDSQVGRLVEDDERAHSDALDDTLAWRSGDVDELSAEEAAMHFVGDDEDEDDALTDRERARRDDLSG